MNEIQNTASFSLLQQPFFQAEAVIRCLWKEGATVSLCVLQHHMHYQCQTN